MELVRENYFNEREHNCNLFFVVVGGTIVVSGREAGDFDLDEAARYILFKLDETLDTIDVDTLNEVLDMFDTTHEN